MQEGLNDFVARIKDLEIQGAKPIAIESLKFLRNYAKERGFGKEFDRAAKRIELARPTAVVLHNCLEIIRKERNAEAIGKLISKLNQVTKEIAKRGSPLIKDGYTIMTHCHSEEAISIIEKAWKEGKKVKVYATETRPKEQGIITAHDLAEMQIPVTLIVDSAIESFIKEVDIVIVGSDAIRKEGIVNKIGTYPMAVVAREHKKPFYVAGDTLKLDGRKKLIIEERSPREICDERMATEDIKNPAFDITPWKFVTRVVMEKGVMTPSNVLRMIK